MKNLFLTFSIIACFSCGSQDTNSAESKINQLEWVENINQTENIEEPTSGSSEIPLFEKLEQQRSVRRREIGLKLGFLENKTWSSDTLRVSNFSMGSKNKTIYLSYRGNYNYYFQMYESVRGENKLIFTDTIDNSKFISDSIWDVNNDGFQDLVINWYPLSGCCIAYLAKIWLFNPMEGSLTLGPKLINPNYFPDKNIIRGFTYGHPGEVSLYTYRWDKMKIDTLEIIEPLPNKLGYKKKVYMPEYKEIIIKEIPLEYHQIDFYKDWVISKDQ